MTNRKKPKVKPKESELPYGHKFKFLTDKNLTPHDGPTGKKIGYFIVSHSCFDDAPDPTEK